MTTVAEEIESMSVDLPAGCQLVIRIDGDVANFTVKRGEEREVLTVRVQAPLTERRWARRWTPNEDDRKWDPERDDVEYARVEWARGGYGRSSMLPRNAAAVAKALSVAAEYADRLNEAVWWDLAEQERAKHEITERVLLEAADVQKKLEAIRDKIQLYIGQTFKLQRRGYKATVYGTIDSVSDRKLHTTSERGVPMLTELLDLETMHIKYDGEKRYTKVFPA
jgi:hypothetical protein